MPKKSLMTAAAAALAIAILSAGPVGAAEQGGPAYSWEEVKTFSIEKKDALVAWLDRQLGQMDEDTAAWADQAGREASAELAEQRRAAASYIDELRAASAEQWEAVKSRTLDVVQDLKETYQSARDDAGAGEAR